MQHKHEISFHLLHWSHTDALPGLPVCLILSVHKVMSTYSKLITIIMKGHEKKVVKYEKYSISVLKYEIQVTLMCSKANTGVKRHFSSGVEIRRQGRRKKNKDVERELSSELPLWKHPHQKAPETLLLFSFLLCLGQSLVESLSDEVRLRVSVSLFLTFITDYMSVLGSNCGVDVQDCLSVLYVQSKSTWVAIPGNIVILTDLVIL